MRTIIVVLFSLLLLAACVPATSVPATSTSPAAPAATAVPATETATLAPPPSVTPALEWGIAFAEVDPLDVEFGGPMYSMALYVVRSDGSDLRQLTGKMESIIGLTASPDGRSLLFSAYREDTSGDNQIVWDDLPHLYVVEVQSGDIFTLTSGVESGEWKSGAWSPDGESIAYASGRIVRGNHTPTGTSYAMCVIRRDGGNKQCTPEKEGFIWSTAWSPTGEKIAFEQNGAVWIVNPDGSELLKAADAPIKYGLDIYEARPVWSPDGHRIAFAAPGVGEEQEPDIFVVNSDGSSLVNITQSPEQDFQPTWSPDGQHIAYISGDWELYVGDINGNSATPLFHNVNAEAYPTVWSPDGSQLLSVTGRTTQGDTKLFIADWPGGASRQLNENLIVADCPAWILFPTH